MFFYKCDNVAGLFWIHKILEGKTTCSIYSRITKSVKTVFHPKVEIK